jgi:hypothetical protein
MGHPLFLLLLLTLLILLAFLGWNLISTRRRHAGKTEGLGGPNDPLS